MPERLVHISDTRKEEHCRPDCIHPLLHPTRTLQTHFPDLKMGRSRLRADVLPKKKKSTPESFDPNVDVNVIGVRKSGIKSAAHVHNSNPEL